MTEVKKELCFSNTEAELEAHKGKTELFEDLAKLIESLDKKVKAIQDKHGVVLSSRVLFKIG